MVHGPESPEGTVTRFNRGPWTLDRGFQTRGTVVPILCMGVNHKTAPLAVRERLAFPASELPVALRALTGLKGISEAVVLSTCNRVECYLVCGDPGRTRGAVVALLRRLRKLPPTSFERAVYEHRDGEAVRHLIEVAASLDSQVVGETQVMGQVRSAHATALKEDATGTVLNGVFNRALAAAKRVRHETEIGRLPASVSSVAVHLAGRIFGGLAGHPVMLLGTGETSVLVAKSLMESGAPRLLVAAEHHFGRAQALAAKYGGEALRLTDAQRRLAEVDIVVVATASADYVIRRQHVADALRQRKSRPVFLVDLSVPRNVEPGIAELADAYLYNLDDLKTVADENLRRRESWLGAAREIVREEVKGTEAWLETLDVVPAIVALQEYGEKCRREVWARAGRGVRHLPPEVVSEIEYLTRALVAKLLHRPVSEIKSRAGRGGASLVEAARRLFGLEP